MKRTAVHFAAFSGLLLLLVLWSGSCNFTPGPALDVQLTAPPTARPTTFDRNLCCCNAVATAVNRSSVTVHATFKFRAVRRNRDGQTEVVGTAIDFVRDFTAGSTRPVEAWGVVASCASFDGFELEDLDVRGVWFPPR